MCCVPECETEIPRTKLMCGRHWSAVPRELKLHIWVLYETGFGRGTMPWQSAVQAAAREARKALPLVPMSGAPVAG